jgi:hypothetical protein
MCVNKTGRRSMRHEIVIASRQCLVLLTLFACDTSAVAGTAVPGSNGSSGAQNFSAQYILASVQPDPFVPAVGLTQKSVIGRCVEIKTNGTLVQDILYSQDSPAALTRETDTWTYTLSGTDIRANDPVGVGFGPTVQRIGSTTDTQITIIRTLRNNGLPAIRTLIFSKVAELNPRCGQ